MLAWAGALAPVLFAWAERGTSSSLLVALCAFGAFGLAYAWASSPRLLERADVRLARALVAVQSVAALVAVHVAPGTATPVLAVVVAAQLPRVVEDGRLTVAWLLVLVGGMVAAFDESPLTAAVFGAVYAAFALFALHASGSAARERSARVALAAANAALVSTRALAEDRAREAERDRLAADLHDALGHDLVALSLNLQAARRTGAGAAQPLVARCEELTAEILEEVRTLVGGRRREALDLAGAARKLVERIPWPRVELQVDDDLEVRDPEVAETALRCLQEAVTNALRHSGATRLDLQIRRRDTRLVITAEDDGRGERGARPPGGLLALAERARRLGGTFTAGGREGGGFSVRMELPMAGGVAA